ncbi:hypothetical protein QR680_015580 [Steinernema hermaphroditum]|uniref:Uncharacterized protein n=1 Tax=Steinernema hermaphroditum TaxID=289476 RepID=A0AA39LL04_9BILA|nr:hypothetical protein QR680_015580 [Steinernema hermaphroditum]
MDYTLFYNNSKGGAMDAYKFFAVVGAIVMTLSVFVVIIIISCITICVALRRVKSLPKTFIGLQMGWFTAMLLYSLIALITQVLRLMMFSDNERPLEFDEFLLNLAFLVDTVLYSVFLLLELYLRLVSAVFRSLPLSAVVIFCTVLNVVPKAVLQFSLSFFTPFPPTELPDVVHIIHNIQLFLGAIFVVFLSVAFVAINYRIGSSIRSCKQRSGIQAESELKDLKASRNIFMFYIIPLSAIITFILLIHLASICLLHFQKSTLLSSLIFSSCPILVTLISGLGTKKMRYYFFSTVMFWTTYHEPETAVRPYREDSGDVTMNQFYAIGVY